MPLLFDLSLMYSTSCSRHLFQSWPHARTEDTETQEDKVLKVFKGTQTGDCWVPNSVQIGALLYQALSSPLPHCPTATQGCRTPDQTCFLRLLFSLAPEMGDSVPDMVENKTRDGGGKGRVVPALTPATCL